MRIHVVFASIVILASSISPAPVLAQAPSGSAAAVARPTRPPLFLKEEWQQIAAGGENPLTQASITNAGVELKLYGPSSDEIQLTGTVGNESNPVHVWTGLCTTACGVTLRDKARMVDLTGLARIKWNTKTSGFHQVRPIVKLADGTWLVGDHTDGTTLDWLTTEFSVAGVRWLELDPERLVTVGNFVEQPDLSRVDEVGFVDLMPASGHGPGGWSDVAQIEIYGKAVDRP
jgi:hypothetical protein